MVVARSLLALTGAVVILAGCTAPAAPSASPGPSASGSGPVPVDRIPVSNTVSRDGVVVTLQIDAGRAASGDKIRLIATATNTEPVSVLWQGGGCDLLGNLQLTGPDVPPIAVGDPGQGDDPASITRLIRWAALVGGAGHTWFVPPNLPPGAAFACTSDLRINELRPGETERIEAIWSGTLADGIPAPAGAYRVRLSFPFLARQAPPFEGDAFADAKPIVVEVPYEVVGDAWVGLSSAQAVDAALADPRIQGWISGIERTSVGGARIQLRDGAVWRFEVDVSGPTGDTAGVVVAEVDPASGVVRRVDIPAG